MDLQRNDASTWNGGVRFRVVHRLHAVEPDLNAVSIGANAVIVPLTERLARLLQDFLRRLGQHLVVAAFVFEGSVRTRPPVGLVTRDFGGVRYALIAELSSSVHKTFRPFELPFESQVKVLK